ncbi:MAG: hypothetical protein P4L92_22830 [Rudaea sp.]|nr:hypothetical protein [Rudaea sp.]
MAITTLVAEHAGYFPARHATLAQFGTERMTQDLRRKVRQAGSRLHGGPRFANRAEPLALAPRCHVVRLCIAGLEHGAQCACHRHDRPVLLRLHPAGRIQAHQVRCEVHLERLQIARCVIAAPRVQSDHAIHPQRRAWRHLVQELGQLVALGKVRVRFAGLRQRHEWRAGDFLPAPGAIERRLAGSHRAAHIAAAVAALVQPFHERLDALDAQIRNGELRIKKLFPQFHGDARRRAPLQLVRVLRHVAIEHHMQRHRGRRLVANRP